jgi:hypothetical protein
MTVSVVQDLSFRGQVVDIGCWSDYFVPASDDRPNKDP